MEGTNMTAEIIIGNAGGLVVAADTTTTSGRIRTYEGAVKVVGLDPPHSVAILHGGPVLLHGVPFLTLIENWAQSLPNKAFNRVRDYAESFSNFVGESIEENIPEIDWLRDWVFQWRGFVGHIYDELRQMGELNPKGVDRYFKARLARFESGERFTDPELTEIVYQRLGKGQELNPLEAECRTDGCVNDKYASIEGVLESFFGKFFTEKSRKTAQKFARAWIGAYHPAPCSATLVFAGYGEKDFVPASSSVNIEAYAFGRLFGSEGHHASAQRIHPSGGFALIESYGQDREILRFINQAGLSPHFSQGAVKDAIQGISRESAKTAEAQGANTTKESGGGTSEADPLRLAEAEITLSLAEIEGRNLSHVRMSLSTMNLSNLVSVAYRLLGLANLAQDLHNELPTVGSDIVVATVTKTGGFKFVDPTSAAPVEWSGEVA
jgi:hypothetical protein